jgi:hypothetical protein
MLSALNADRMPVRRSDALCSACRQNKLAPGRVQQNSIVIYTFTGFQFHSEFPERVFN